MTQTYSTAPLDEKKLGPTLHYSLHISKAVDERLNALAQGYDMKPNQFALLVLNEALNAAAKGAEVKIPSFKITKSNGGIVRRPFDLPRAMDEKVTACRNQYRLPGCEMIWALVEWRLRERATLGERTPERQDLRRKAALFANTKQ